MIAVVVVTYGDRRELLSAVLQRLLAPESSELISEIIVVDNASSSCTKELLSRLVSIDARVKVVTLETNEGSAGGYSRGLTRAVEGSGEFVLLLDDDNLPCPSAFERLIESWRILKEAIPDGRFALQCTRWDHDYHRRLAFGEPVESVYPGRSSYCGLHIRQVPRRISTILSGRKADDSVEIRREPVSIPYGPYGGLFIRRELLARIELPDPRFFTYADDFDFTHRFVTAGIPLYLIPTCRVQDIDSSWSNDSQHRSVLRSIFLHSSDARVFLSLRNQVYFEKTIKKNPLLYMLNRLCFVLLLIGGALRYGRWRRLVLALNALIRGEMGRMQRPDSLII
jgi:GT2 family glycosyltransferase